MACYLAPWKNNQNYWVDDQFGWIETHNEWHEIFASTSDIYRAGKECSPKNLLRLQLDFAKRKFVTSTQMFYQDLKMSIIHHRGSKVIPQSDKTIVSLDKSFYFNNALYLGKNVCWNQEALSKHHPPRDYDRPFSLDYLLQQEKGLTYLQALLSTSDEPENILQTLERFSGKKRNDLYIKRTPQEKSEHYALAIDMKENKLSISFIPTSNYRKHAACAAVFDEETSKKLDENGDMNYVLGESRFNKDSFSKSYLPD